MLMNGTSDVSVFIGRFQPFHLGHLAVLKQCPTNNVIIGIGSSQYHHSLKNPFTFTERKKMIQLTLNNTSNFNIKYDIYSVPDIHDPPHWVDYVKKILPPFSMVLTNNDFTADLFKKKGYQVTQPGLVQRKQYQGKEIRKRMINNKPWEAFVPTSVATYLLEINAEKRLQQLYQQSQQH
jgi:nicotinamide-nucleotide adenylyltransferase